MIILISFFEILLLYLYLFIKIYISIKVSYLYLNFINNLIFNNTFYVFFLNHNTFNVKIIIYSIT